MKRSTVTARSLRVILAVTIVLILAASIAGFYFAQKELRSYSATISELNANAKSGDNNITAYRRLTEELAKNQASASKAKSIVAQSKEFKYQDQIVTDLSAIAAKSKVTILSYSFGATTAAAGTATPAPAPSTTAPVTTPASGLNTKSVSITINSPLEYTNLMAFIREIESNPLKMQIGSVSLTKGTGTTVASQGFTIEVYVQ